MEILIYRKRCLFSDVYKRQDECSGYVIIRNEEVKEYEAYITCQAYTTKDYGENK